MLPDVALRVGGGVLAGVIGSAGGITSLVSYPVLLATGVGPFAANVANLVALVGCWPGSALVSRSEVAVQRRWLARGVLAAAAGGTAGTVLLLTTPASLFERIVPALVALGSLTLLCQPAITTRAQRGGLHRRIAPSLVTVGGVSVYGGYFGAGSGVMLLAVALILLDDRMPVANAVKNMLAGASTAASAVVLVVAGPVPWSAVWPLAAGLFVGSLAGPVIARRLPAAVIRWTVGVLGLGLAVRLALG